MKKYSVVGEVTGSKFLGVFEANSVEEAIQKAYNSKNGCVSFCHQCSNDCQDPELSIEEDMVEEV